jgi:hypothetical protein
MKDIFDIMQNIKNHHIKIKGEISEHTLTYDMDTVNDFISMLLDNKDHMDTTRFEVRETNKDTVDRGIYTPIYNIEYKAIIFDIDIHIDDYLYHEIEDYDDFIDYYTVGSVRYDNQHISERMIDSLEEYMSGRISDPMYFEMEYNTNWVMMDELFNIESRPVVGHREYDADGDAVFAAEFRPTDFSGMFRNCNNFDLSRLD